MVDSRLYGVVESYGVDPDTIDVKAIYDSDLSFTENRRKIAEVSKLLNPNWRTLRRNGNGGRKHSERLRSRLNLKSGKKRKVVKVARKLSPYNRHVKREMKKGKSMKAAARSWKSKKTKTRTRKTKKTKVRKMAKRRTRRKTRARSKSRSKRRSAPRTDNLLEKGLLLGAGAITTTVVMDYAVSGTLPTMDTVQSRISGIFNKLGDKIYLYPIALGGVLAARKLPVKIPGVSKGKAALIGLGMIAAASFSAATVPGSPGKPIAGHTTRRLGGVPNVRVISNEDYRR